MKSYPLLTIDKQFSSIILADGDYPTHPLPLALLSKSTNVVCCDGATDTFVDKGGVPQAIVGDGDSLSQANKERFAHCLYQVPCQETNDLTKAVNFCLERNHTDLLILGATGKREDHTLGNISLLVEYMEQANVEMVTDYGVFTPISEDSQFQSFAGQQVSIFNLSDAIVSQDGLQYTLPPLHRWWQGTLNQSNGDSFVIRTTGKVIVFRAY